MNNHYSWLALFLFFCIFGTQVLPAQDFKVLVFSRTLGFRHSSIPAGIAAIQQLGLDHSFEVVTTEDPNQFIFDQDHLQQFAVVIFLNTTGDILNNAQQVAFELYIQNGGGYVGIHSAADTEYGWPFYGELVGGYFKNHPAIQEGDIKVLDALHPSTKNLPSIWMRRDEWYNYRDNPRGNVHVLATLDEQSYNGGEMGHDHPIAWCHEYKGGRAWYTGGGHTPESFSEPLFLDHLLGGILFAAGQVEGDFDATLDENLEVTVLDNNPKNPMALAVLPDLRVLYIERNGKIKIYSPTNGDISEAGSLNVDINREDGLLGVAIDPDFENNSWVYLFYSPFGDFSKQHLSRFLLVDNQLDMNSEQIILEIPVQREECCHSGGDLEFDAQGNLYIAIGDNTSAFQSDGYAPIDERPGRAPFDAQGTSANTRDLRGKILRIHPEADGSYTIPEGNLFTDPNEGLPEIYIMGTRNPFRIAVDQQTSTLYWGDVGPDGFTFNENRGPFGYDEFNRAFSAGNYGWPYCVANNQPYKDYDFATGISGDWFDCDALVNNSPNNTGATNLPPAKEAWIWYPYGMPTDFPAMVAGDGRCAMAGAVYKYDSLAPSNVQFPPYYDNSIFLYEWSRNYIREVKVDENGDIINMTPFYSSFNFNRPIDMHFGPDGAMYLIEWGTGFWGDNEDARILKIGYKKGGKVPQVVAMASPEFGAIPLEVNFSAEGTFDPDIDDFLTYEWDFDDDGVYDANGITTQYTYLEKGNYQAKLRVTDTKGNEAFASLKILAGNSLPVVHFEYPPSGGFYEPGDTIPFQVVVNDLEDGSSENGEVNCDAISVLPAIGHDDHAHDGVAVENCEGIFITEPHGESGDNVFYVARGIYEDAGNDPVESLTGVGRVLLHPKLKEAEFFNQQEGITIEMTDDFLGGRMQLAEINAGDYIAFEEMNLKNIDFISFRASSKTEGGWVSLRKDAIDGLELARRSISGRDNEEEWDYYTVDIAPTDTMQNLYVVFNHPSSNEALFDLNWLEFHGKGVATTDSDSLKGLRASYFNQSNFAGDPLLIRKDPMVAFDWESGAPINGMNADNISIRWEGMVEPSTPGFYTFQIQYENGIVVVELDGEEIINSNAQSMEESDPILLDGGQKYPIKIEYQHLEGDASMNLRWMNAELPMNVIHQDYLHYEKLMIVDSNTEQFLNQKISLIPNPFQESFMISLPNSTSFHTLNIYDLTGKQVQQKLISPEEHNFELPATFETGIYFFEFRSDCCATVIKGIKI